MKNQKTYSITDDFMQKLLNWSNQFSSVCFLESADKTSNFNNYDCLLAVSSENQYLSSLTQIIAKTETENDWLFGYLSYDLKNSFEDLTSNNTDHLQFPEIHFFIPETVFEINQYSCVIHSKHNTDVIFEKINSSLESQSNELNDFEIKNRVPHGKYIENVEIIKQHIQQGNVYELNYCQEFYVEGQVFDPIYLYKELVRKAPAPFSAFYKLDDKYAICASPERFLKKIEDKLISQPIKGTAPRSEDTKVDAEILQNLKTSNKDKAENVMIVDLVRNDLSKIAKKGTVKVDGMFEISAFEHWYQMISTISCELKANSDFTEIIKATFPMGSMTGAPKYHAMQIIEELEDTKRGLFSGAIGYIKPNGDFDFNVVIRSILYNATNKYLSFMTGSAITINSEAENEYEECLLKAKGILSVLQNNKVEI